MRFFGIAALLVVAGCAWAQDGPPPGQKPLRERLLERALKGDAEAQFDLAKNYEAGRIGLTKNLDEAQHWYREAANQGEPFAQASLAILYNFGKGVRRDLVQAYMWYELAAEHTKGGDRESIVEMRDNAAAGMTKEQLAEARKLAAAWKPAGKN